LESGLRVKVASVTYFPPYGERGVNSPDRRAGHGSAGRGGRGWLKGGSLKAKMLQVEQKKRRLRSAEAA